MNEAIGQSLPFAVGVGLSPIPIIAVVLMLATPRARVNGPAFLVGWVVGLAIVGGIVLVVAGGLDAASDDGPATWVSVLKLVLGALLALLGVKQWRGRPRGDEEAALPKWMTTIDHFGPAKALGFGAAAVGREPEEPAADRRRRGGDRGRPGSRPVRRRSRWLSSSSSGRSASAGRS